MEQHVIANSALEPVKDELEATRGAIIKTSGENEQIDKDNSHLRQSPEGKQKTIKHH